MKFSIITATLNSLVPFRSTLESLKGHAETPVILVDGGSGDGTLQYAKNRNSERPLTIISEPDSGPYDAMNKGIKIASTEYLLFLNAGDLLQPEALKVAVEQTDGADIVYCDATLDYGRSQKSVQKHPSSIKWSYWLTHNICHQAVLFRRDLFERKGLYDISYRLAADYEFYLRCFKDPTVRFKHIPVTLVNYDMSGMSAKPENYQQLMEEYHRARLQHFPPHLKVLEKARWTLKHNTRLKTSPILQPFRKLMKAAYKSLIERRPER